jgi:hypothetical protein
MMLAMLVPLGIEKGKPFSPNDRQKRTLEQAANVGELTARANSYAKRFPGSVVWPGKEWEYSLFLKATDQEVPTHTQLDERASWFYEAVGVTVGMLGRTVGAGQVHLKAYKDSTDQWLDGGNHYTLHVPKDVPVEQFWSFTVYDNESRCLIDPGMHPDRSSRDDIVTNADGSVEPLLWSDAACRQGGEELDQHPAQQGLVHLLPALRPQAGLFRQVLGATGHQEGRG